ncbi:MAG TPA: epoxide hydrolase [Gammaproteobacteria bacterium]|nr:epoxide hydrolase [Gammaproteobacteria bacterium]
MSEIRKFQLEVTDAVLDDLKKRLSMTRWPNKETPEDWSQGIPLGYMKELCDYWLHEYDWRAREERLNRFPQFITEIDGVDIHFIHLPSVHQNARPLIITHGWPGSVVEFHKVIEPLADPTAHGGNTEDAFHVVVPSLPGYGFSGKPEVTGWGIEKIADIWGELMARLGYDHYFAQGGDWGAMVTTHIGLQDKEHCDAIHLNMPVVIPDPNTMAELTPSEQASLMSMKFYQDWDSGYSKQQSTRPQTVGYGLVDSPSGQAAWIIEKFYQWTDCNGHPENAISRDELLDNVMMYWLSKSAASSARLYWESFKNPPQDEVDIPTGCSIFPKEIVRPSERWIRKRFTNLKYYNELEKGGHFAAFEQPEIFLQEIRTYFRSLR